MAVMLAGTMLAGCGGGDSGASGAEDANKLTIMCWTNENDFAPVLEGFKAANPDIEVDFQHVPSEGNQYQHKLNLLANSEELPDVYWINSPIDNFAKNGYMKDLTDMEFVQKLPDTYKDAYTYEGKVYAYAPDSWIGGMFYNKDLYAKYNLEAPKNWDEFLGQSKIFMKDGIKPIAMAGTQLMDMIVWLHNTEDIAKDNTLDEKINKGEKKFSEVYAGAMEKWYKDCVKSGIITQDMIGITDEQRMGDFRNNGKKSGYEYGNYSLCGNRRKCLYDGSCQYRNCRQLKGKA